MVVNTSPERVSFGHVDSGLPRPKDFDFSDLTTSYFSFSSYIASYHTWSEFSCPNLVGRRSNWLNGKERGEDGFIFRHHNLDTRSLASREPFTSEHFLKQNFRPRICHEVELPYTRPSQNVSKRDGPECETTSEDGGLGRRN
jgi:transposase